MAMGLPETEEKALGQCQPLKYSFLRACTSKPRNLPSTRRRAAARLYVLFGFGFTIRYYFASAQYSLKASSLPPGTTGENQAPAAESLADKGDIDTGFLSNKPIEFFRDFQHKIDEEDPVARCERYGFTYNRTRPKNRRIFYGALVASEPWELFHIAAAESFSIFAGMVFVESNRTQNFSQRNFSRLDSEHIFRELYGVDNVQVRPFVNEDSSLLDLAREHAQRAEILLGWKAIGMMPDDVGLLTDADEIFTRDMLRAMQICNTPHLDYDQNNCHYRKVGIRASTQVFESSPECIADGRSWYHPDVLIGHCIEEVGNETVHPKAPRKQGSFLRATGFGSDGWHNITKDVPNPLYSAGDYRRVGPTFSAVVDKRKNPGYSMYTAFHFHNFFTSPNAIRFKYRTYGHPDKRAYSKSLEELNPGDLGLMVKCVRNMSDQDLQYHRVKGGFGSLLPFRPIYFEDAEYRSQRHTFIQNMVVAEAQHSLKASSLPPGTRGENQAPAAESVASVAAPAHNRGAHNNTAKSDTDDQQEVGKGGGKTFKRNDRSLAFDENKGDIDTGFLSNKPIEFFRDFQHKIDEEDPVARCERYGFTYNRARPKNRRIFYGALVASEPWELFHIAAAESFGIFAGIVFVESNRTQNFSQRNFSRLDSEHIFRELYGVDNVQVRPFVNEDSSLRDLAREHAQRAEILLGWKEIGMMPDDVGLLTDADEIFTRDMLRAMQICNTPHLDYDQNNCHYRKVGIRASTQVFESSPECIADGRSWYHPDVLIGHCIEEVGNETVHPKAPRKQGSFLRATGFGSDGWHNITKDVPNPLYSAGDYRRVGPTFSAVVDKRKNPGYSMYTAFHFHNFFTSPNAIRFKYRTYGHPDKRAYSKSLEELNPGDLGLMVKCVRNMSDQDLQYHRVKGGFGSLLPFRPIYFEDAEYRSQRHTFIQNMVVAEAQHSLKASSLPPGTRGENQAPAAESVASVAAPAHNRGAHNITAQREVPLVDLLRVVG